MKTLPPNTPAPSPARRMGPAIAGALCLFGLAGAAAADVIVINFDFYPGPDGILGTPDDIPIVAPSTFAAQPEQLTNQFASVGVLFVPDPAENDKNEILISTSFQVPPTATPPNLLASSGTRTIEGIFTIPVTEVGAILGISGGADRLDIYDQSNNLLGSVVGDDTFETLVSSVPIYRFVISPVASTTPAIDNFTFVTAGPSGCYANCDGSTIEPILNVDDFTCFINEYAAAQNLPHEQQVSAYANCDGSTIAPALNVDDFTCFINQYAQGCP
jgi:hypothetical protein